MARMLGKRVVERNCPCGCFPDFAPWKANERRQSRRRERRRERQAWRRESGI